MKTYRCGWCGSPCNEYGQPFNLDACKLLTDEQLNNAELVHGDCCVNQQEHQRMRVTRDMAIDAGDLSLEGELI